jgi:hypothetical protein
VSEQFYGEYEELYLSETGPKEVRFFYSGGMWRWNTLGFPYFVEIWNVDTGWIRDE